MSRARDVADGALGTIAGTNGQVLTSDGSAWSSQAVPTELPAHGADGNILASTGSAWASEANPLPAHGTSGNVLTSTGSAWASQAAGGGGAWQYITTVGHNNSADLTFSNVFSASYDTYIFVGGKLRPVSSNNQSLLFSFIVPAGVSTGNIRQQIEYSGNTSGNSTYNSWASGTSLQTYYLMNYEGQDTTGTGEMNFVMYVNNPFLNNLRGGTNQARSNYRMLYHTGQNSSDFNTVTVNKIQSVGVWQQTTQATGARFMMGSGNMQGNIDLYGLKHSS